ncbi:endonuclease [Chryseobacterium sp. MFBS3-17]|uniref:endonuclease/exonuclease/phosphatase family protein n=1 Tax=Chryseobacterium sp. MFBS3-17 TaxID=2886689 RepID=UPI001D0EFEB2|nr:endonuclease [Chryseobacterium sp. MFBS3-17]MCC2591126.1 endonuclease [Chryseobacterium sp. MFBS3-17]
MDVQPEHTELAVFYNTENFYSPDPKSRHRLNPAPSGLKNWNPARFENKLKKVAHVFELMKEDFGVLPMMAGLSEVQGKLVVEKLMDEPVFGGRFGMVHFESMDERGVDVALIYDRLKIEIISAEPVSFFFAIDEDKESDRFDTTRDVLQVKLRYQDMVMHVFVFHLPSKREKDVNHPKRKLIIKEINERIRKIRTETDEAVLIMGDFNENPDEDNVKILLNNNDLAIGIRNPFQALFQQQQYSTFHQRSGLLFDQMLLSKDFFGGTAALRFQQAGVFSHYKLKSWDRKFSDRPFRTYAGTRYLGGYSDHFPVYVHFTKI